MVSSFLMMAQDRYAVLRNELHKDGFIYVRIVEHDNELVVGFENKRYRSEIEALSKVLKLVYHQEDPFMSVVLIAHKMQMPIAQIVVPRDKLDSLFEKKITPKAFSEIVDVSYVGATYSNLLKQAEASNTFRFGVDLFFEPKLRFQLGSLDHPFRFHYRVLPGLETSFWKGQKLVLQASVPLYSHYVDTYNYVSPHIIKFEQNLRLGKGLYSRLNIGWFTEKRYGVDIELLKYLFDGRLMLRANGGYTGHMLYVKKGNYGLSNTKYETSSIEFDALDYSQYFLNIEYRIPKYDLVVGAGYGKYLYENNAYSFDLYRHFNECVFGVHAIFSETGHNFGFNISLPLLPSQYYQNKKFSLRPSKYIKYSYLATQDYVGAYHTGSIINEVIRELNPKMIENFMYNTLFVQ